MIESSPKVFISYTHDSEEHRNRVRRLSDRLREDGIDCEIDQYHEDRPIDWPNWMMSQIATAQFVLIVCSENYLRRFTGNEEPAIGLGGKWEGGIVRQSLYEAGGENEKFLPVIFDPEDSRHVPIVLKGAPRFLVVDEAGYERLYRRITEQPKVEKPRLGNIIRLPSSDDSTTPTDHSIRQSSNATNRATRFAEELQTNVRSADGVSVKFRLLTPAEQNFVVSSLVESIDSPGALVALAKIAGDPPEDLDLRGFANAMVEAIAFSQDVALKARFMSIFPAGVLLLADANVRSAFYAEVVDIMHRDQYAEVNVITPAVVKVQATIPEDQKVPYIRALISQLHSAAFQGAPAAEDGLRNLPGNLRRAAFIVIDRVALLSSPSEEAIADFLEAQRKNWPNGREELYADYISFDSREFMEKYMGSEFNPTSTDDRNPRDGESAVP